MAESDHARIMRREAEKQTRFASDQAYYAEQSLQQQTDTARAAHAAARAADEATEAAAAHARWIEENAAEQLEEQLLHNSRVADHNFAMWRQTTANGEQYERWAKEAAPLVAIFTRRWNEWLAAKEADLQSFAAKKESESIKRFGVDAELAKRNIKDVSHPLSDALAVIVGAFFGLLILWALAWVVGWTYVGFAPTTWTWMPSTKLLLQIGAGEIIFLGIFAVFQIFSYPAAKKSYKARCLDITNAKTNDLAARNWVKSEVASFSSGLPSIWRAEGEGYAWEQLRKANETLHRMPTDYVEFQPEMLVDLSDGLPFPAPASTLHPKAAQTRALISSWS